MFMLHIKIRKCNNLKMRVEYLCICIRVLHFDINSILFPRHSYKQMKKTKITNNISQKARRAISSNLFVPLAVTTQ